MCGIIGVVQGEDGREPVPLADLFAEIDAVRAALDFSGPAQIARCAVAVERVDAMLRGVRGVVTLAQEAGAADVVRSFGDDVWRHIESYEAGLDTGDLTDDLEDVN